MFTIYANIRKEHGKSASRRLRAINKLPAIVYSGQDEPISIELDHEKIWNIQNKLEFYSEVLTIIINNKKEKVKVKNIQRHAFKPKLIHIDFIRVSQSKN